MFLIGFQSFSNPSENLLFIFFFSRTTKKQMKRSTSHLLPAYVSLFIDCLIQDFSFTCCLNHTTMLGLKSYKHIRSTYCLSHTSILALLRTVVLFFSSVLETFSYSLASFYVIKTVFVLPSLYWISAVKLPPA